MTSDKDPLDEYTAAFRAAPVPEPVRELLDEDKASRRVVAWMGAALAAQAPSVGTPPVALLQRRRLARPRWRLLPGRPALAAAAVLLVLLGAALWLSERGERRDAAPVAAGPGLDAPVADVPEPVAIEPVAPVAEVRPAPGLVAVTEDRLELRSGPVRLLLFLNPEPNSLEDPR